MQHINYELNSHKIVVIINSYQTFI